MKRSAEEEEAAASLPAKAARVEAEACGLPSSALARAHSISLEGDLTDAQVVASLADVGGPQLDGLAVKTTSTLGAVAAKALGAAFANVLDVSEAAFGDRAEAALVEALSRNPHVSGVRTANPEAFDDLNELRAARDLAPLDINAEEEEEEEEEEDDDDEGVYCDGGDDADPCGAVLAGDDVVFTDGSSDYCAACAKNVTLRSLRETTAQARFAEVLEEDADSGGGESS